MIVRTKCSPWWKTRQDNDVIDCIGEVYSKIETKLSEPIGLDVISDETRYDNDVTDFTSVVYAEKET